RGVEPRHVGIGGMRRVPEHLAEGLDVRTAVRVDRLDLGAGAVTALVGDEPMATGRAAILTPPLPQALDLLTASGIWLGSATRAMLDPIDYDACLAVMAHLNGPSGLPDGHATPDDGVVAWVADNQHKGTSPLPAITIHSTPEFAAEHLESDPERWVAALVAATEPLLASSVVAAVGHRWRYAMPRQTLDIGALAVVDDPPILLAGEVFAGARVEGAFLSGLAAVKHLLGAPSGT
ncbi:MAG: FAD-dependent oxidoreductase, partial [Acidimicrobiia bacterium]